MHFFLSKEHMFQLIFEKSFRKKYQKIVQKDKALEGIIKKTLATLMEDPFSSKLKTHKAETKAQGKRYSSRVNGDIRIIWDFQNNIPHVIEIFDIGGHSGKTKVYA